MSDQNTGPIYGAHLPESLPIGNMFQKVPRRNELKQVMNRVGDRTVAALEVALTKLQEMERSLKALPELLEIAEAARAVITGMEIRKEDEAEFAAAGWRVSADEMQKRMDRLNVAVSIYQTMAIQYSSEEDSKSISCDHLWAYPGQPWPEGRLCTKCNHYEADPTLDGVREN